MCFLCTQCIMGWSQGNREEPSRKDTIVSCALYPQLMDDVCIALYSLQNMLILTPLNDHEG